MINNTHLFEFARLYADMLSTHTDYSAFQALHYLVNKIAEKEFMAFGLFNDKEELVGFSCGWIEEKKVFYFSGIYVIIKNTKWTKKLIDFSFEQVGKFCDAWECDATNSNIASILEKYGAKVVKTTYRKELHNG